MKNISKLRTATPVHEKTYKFSYFHAFLLPVIGMILMLILNRVYPFGEFSYLKSDLYSQYILFINHFSNMIREGNDLAYSFNLGLGTSTSLWFAYYLASPTNLIYVLIPTSYLIEAIAVVSIIKVGFIGVSFAYYIANHYGKKDLGTLMTSVVYALSGYMVAYYWNIMWLDVLILTPIVILELENMIKTGKGSKYCAWLGLAIFSNFYLSFMLCLFVVAYFIVLLVFEPREVWLNRCLRFAGYSVLSALMAAVIFIPSILFMLGVNAGTSTLPSDFQVYFNPLEFASRHVFGVEMIVRSDSLPNIFSSSAVFFLVPLFFIRKTIDKKRKIINFVLLAVFYLSFNINIFEFVWHLFDTPNALPARQGFLYVFVLIIISYEAISDFNKIKLKEVLISVLMGITTIVLCMLFVESDALELNNYLYSIAFISLYLMFFLLYKFTPSVDENFKKKCKIINIVCVLIFYEMFSNFALATIKFENRDKFWNYFDKLSSTVEVLEAYDQSFYRINNMKHITHNDSMILGIKTANSFSSAINKNVGAMYEALGVYSKNSTTYEFAGYTPLVGALTNIKYYVSDGHAILDFFDTLFESSEKGYAYEAQYYLPVSYMVEKEFADANIFDEENPFEAQNKLCELLGIEDPLFYEAYVERIDDIGFKLNIEEDGHYYAFTGRERGTEISIVKNIDKQNYDEIVEKIRGNEFVDTQGIVRRGRIENLRILERGSQYGFIALANLSQEEYVGSEPKSEEIIEFYAYRINEETLDKAINILGKNPLNDVTNTSSTLSGTVTSKEGGTLIVSIPVEPGWKVYVNDEEYDYGTFMDLFFAIDLPPGTHKIHLEYKMPGIYFGGSVSVLAIFALIFCLFKEGYFSTRIKKLKIRKEN